MRKISFVRTLILTAMLLWGTTSRADDGWWIYRNGEGKDEPLCKTLLKRLAHNDPRPDPRDRRGCPHDVLISYPKFSEPPWEELDPKEHEELIFKLMKYGNKGPDGYFHRLPGLKAKQPDWVYKNHVKDFMQQHSRMRLWRTRLVSVYGDPRHPAPPGEQTIVQIDIILPATPPGYCRDRTWRLAA